MNTRFLVSARMPRCFLTVDAPEPPVSVVTSMSAVVVVVAVIEVDQDTRFLKFFRSSWIRRGPTGEVGGPTGTSFSGTVVLLVFNSSRDSDSVGEDIFVLHGNENRRSDEKNARAPGIVYRVGI